MSGATIDVITEFATERVGFACRHCGHEWAADYELAHFEEADGAVFEYFAVDDRLVPSPYVTGTVICPVCRQPSAIGHLLGRRLHPDQR